MDKFYFPDHTQVVLRLGSLMRIRESRYLSERMSTRMVRSACVLTPEGFLGWQMKVPKRGLSEVTLFGSGELSKKDLVWISEKTGKADKEELGRGDLLHEPEFVQGCERAKLQTRLSNRIDGVESEFLEEMARREADAKEGFEAGEATNEAPQPGRQEEGEVLEELSYLYEIYLPIAESYREVPVIGFGKEAASFGEESFSNWPDAYSCQFEELTSVLRDTGAILRVVTGPASWQEQKDCHRRLLTSYDLATIPLKEYVERPVKLRVLLRLPCAPSIRLKTILQACVSGVSLRKIGQMGEEMADALWKDPLESAPVLPDCAARILMLEPEVHDFALGFQTYEPPMKKLLASHENTREKGAVEIGRATDTSGIRRTITIGEMDLKRHYQIVGQTGTGKSTLLANLILSAMEQGHGLTFFDPHGSTIDVVLRCLPEEYMDRVRVVRLGDAQNPVPLNIWDSDDPDKEERTINDLCELFGNIYNPPGGGVFVGPRWERWFSVFAKASIAFLGRRASFESISVISQSQKNMLKVSKAIVEKYPRLVDTIREEYGTDNSSDFHSSLNWYLCKFQNLLSVEQLRKTLGAGDNALDFSHSIDTNTVTFIDLASPAIGTHASRVVGTLLMMKLWNAALKRRERNRTHLVVVDEASLFQTNPMPRMLAESRKFGISMVLCHQHTGQLTPEIQDALEANSANFSAFRLSLRDARRAALRLDHPDMEIGLSRLDAFQAITTLSVDGRQSAPFTLEISRPRQQKRGELIASMVEQQSIERLVKPYESMRALTSKEIQELLDDPEKRKRFLKREALPGKPKMEKPGTSEGSLERERPMRDESDKKENPEGAPDWLLKWEEERKRLLKREFI